MSKNTIGAGFRVLWYGVRNSNGVFIGSTATTPTAGVAAGSGLARLFGARTIPFGIPETVIVPVSGDDEPMVTFEFDPEDLPNGVFEMAQRDNVFDALIQQTKVHTIGDIEVTVYDPMGRQAQSMCMLLSRIAKSWKSGEKGAKKWENWFIHQAGIKPLGPAAVTQREFGPYRYRMNTSRGDLGPGFSINETEHGTTGTSISVIDSDNPLYYQTWRGNNALLTYTMSYAPVSGAKSYIYLDHLRKTLTTDYSISGTSLIFIAAPGQDVVIEALTEVAEGTLL